MTTVLKLGGSVVTEKSAPQTLDREAIAEAAGVLGDHAGTDPLVLVHGGGSFGHPLAAEHGISETEGTHDARAVATIHRSMGELNDAVVATLHEEGVSALPVRPLSVAHRDDGLSLPAGQVAAMLGEGFVPVLHGDAVVHAGEGCTILSGDEIVVALARALDADRVGLCSTVPGVLDEQGEVIPEIEAYAAVADALGDSDATDVTGGMAGKVRALLDLESPASVFSLSALDTFLDTGTAGTTIQ
jgi:isopentenyl phosphate kinase